MRDIDKPFSVEVVEYDTDTIVHRVYCDSERQAEKVDRGMNINLNHERFYTRISGKSKDKASA